jgi:hypothetical protein
MEKKKDMNNIKVFETKFQVEKLFCSNILIELGNRKKIEYKHFLLLKEFYQPALSV